MSIAVAIPVEAAIEFNIYCGGDVNIVELD